MTLSGPASTDEGDRVVFSVTLDRQSSQTLEVVYSSDDVSAVAPEDYQAVLNSLFFSAGTTKLTIGVQTFDDQTGECTEDFQLIAHDVMADAVCYNVILGVYTAVVTIVDNDAGSLSVPAPAFGDEGTRLVFDVTLDRAGAQTVQVNYATSDETAESGIDYVATSGTLEFSAGTTWLTVGVPTINDSSNECDETFELELSNPDTGCLDFDVMALSHGLITDNDPVALNNPGVISGLEGDDGVTIFTFLISLTGASEQSVSVDYETRDGTATSLADYDAKSGVATFLPGTTQFQIEVNVNGDTIHECDESFDLALTNFLVNCPEFEPPAERAAFISTATIEEDDDVNIEIGDAVVTEGTEAPSTLHFIVTLENPSVHEISVQYSTDHVSTTSGDYQAVTNGLLTFTPGNTRTSLDVVVFEDSANECDEEMFVELHSPAAPCPVVIVQDKGFGTIEDDDAPLFVTCPGDLTVSTDVGFCDTVVNLPVPEVDDACGVSINLELPFDPSAVFPIGRTEVSYIAEDEHGQTAECNFFVTVVDTIPPVVTCPGNVIISCGLGTDPGQTGTATAADNCDSAPIISHTDDVNPPDCTQAATVVRTWTATDTAGYESSCQQNIDLVLAIGWQGDVTGDFDDPANWEGGIVPDASTHVVIAAAGSLTITLTNPTTLASLTIGGPAAAREEIVHTLIVEDDLVLLDDSLIDETGVLVIRDGANVRTAGVLDVVGQVTIEEGSLECLETANIEGRLNWSNGTIAGAGPIVLNGEANLQDDFEKILDGPVFKLTGIANWTGGNVTLDGSALIDIGPQGALHVTADGKRMFADSGESGRNSAGSVNNEGQITSDVPNNVTLNLPIDYQGTINVIGGDLQIFDIYNRGLGEMTVAAGAFLSFDGGFHQLGDPRNIQGDGSVRFLGGLSSFDLDQTINEDTPATIAVADPPLFVSGVNDPANGIAVDEGDGLVRYSPDPDFNGIDDISGQLSGAAGVALFNIQVTVNPVSDPPVAMPGGPYAGEIGGIVELDGRASFDPDNEDPFPTGASWSFDGVTEHANGITYNLDLNGPFSAHFEGPADPDTNLPTNVISFTVEDNEGNENTAITTLTIYDNRPFAAATADPSPAACQQEIIFDAGGSRHGHPGHSIVGYEWDFGDGSVPLTTAMPNVTHAYDRFGTFTATVTVTDDNVSPRTDHATLAVDVNRGNQPPVADAGGPYDVEFGGGITFDSSQSSEPDEQCGDGIVMYEWDLNGNGQFVDSSNPNPVLTWNQLMALGWSDGETRTIRLRVLDDRNASDIDSTQLTTGTNGRPTARAGGPYQFNEGLSVNLDGSGSTDPENGVLTFEWAIDGNILPLAALDPSPALDWATLVGAGTCDPGQYSGQLTVTDAGGATHADSFSLTIDNLLPLVTLPAGLEIFDGDNVTVSSPNVTATIDDVSLDKGRHTFSVDWGDSTPPDSGTLTGPAFLPDVTHAYDQSGIFSLSLTVTDIGGESRTATSTVIVQNHDPAVVITQSSAGNVISEGSTLLFELDLGSAPGEFHAQFSDLSPQDSHTAIIDWGDGLVQPVAVDQENDVVLASHLFGTDGIYTIRVTVTDLNGGTATAPTQVEVTPAALSRHWTNSIGDRNWANPANWDPPGVPDNTDSVVFGAGVAGPIVDDTFELHRLTLAGDFGGVFDIGPNGILTVETVTTINGGTFNLGGVLRIGGNLLIGPTVNGFFSNGAIDFFGGTPEVPLVIADLFGANLGVTLVTGQIALATPLLVRDMEVDSGQVKTELQPLTLTGSLHLGNGGEMNIGAGAIIGGDTLIDTGGLLEIGPSTRLPERSTGDPVHFLGGLTVAGEFMVTNRNVKFHGAVVVPTGEFDVFGPGFVLRFGPAGIKVTDGDLILSGSPGGELLIGSLGAVPHVFEVTTDDLVELEYLGVENSNADSGMPLAPLFSTDLGGNTQWFFGSPLLGFTSAPVDTPFGETMPSIEVAILDALGNVMPEFNGDIEVALLDNPTNAVLDGPALILPTTAGTATFTGLSLDRLGTGFTLEATGTGIERDVGGEGSSRSAYQTVSPPFNTMTCGYGVWFMDGTVFEANAIIPFVLNEGELIKAIGDFDGDGNADIFTFNDNTMESWFWFMDGSRVKSREELLDPARTEDPATVDVVGAGDFNRDGRDELLKRDLFTGDNHLVVVNGHVVQDQLTLPAESDTDLKVAGTGDLDVDGSIDILWQDTQTGTISVWFMDGTTRPGAPATLNAVTSAGTEVVGVGDFNADGGVDLVVRLSSDAREADTPPVAEVWIMDGLDVDSIATLPAMPDWNDHVVDVGDFDDDDGADILWRYCTALSRDFAENNAVALHPPPAAVVRSDDVVEIGVEGLPTAMTWMPVFDNAERTVADGLRYELFVSQHLTTLGNYLDFLNGIRNNWNTMMDEDGSMFIEVAGEFVQIFDILEVNEVSEEISPGVFEMIFDYGVILDQDAADGPAYTVDPLNESFPIFGVTWEGAVIYCNWLSNQKGLILDDFAYIVDQNGFRPRHLSPEDWADGFDADERREWLARYPFAYRLPMDNQAIGSDPFNEYYAYAAGASEDVVGSPRGGNFWGSGDFFEPGPTPVGYFGTNDVGVSDAVGNAWEWMSDSFVSGDTSTWAVRGASWYNHQELLTTTQRFPVVNAGFADVSFRVVCGADAVFQIRVDEVAGAREGPQTNYDHEYDWSGSRIFAPELTESTGYEWAFRMIHPGLSIAVPPWPEPAREAPETFTTTDQVAKNITIDLAEDWNLLALDNDPTQRHPKFQFGFPTTTWGWDNESQQYFKLFEAAAFDGFWVHMDQAFLDFVIEGFTPASSIYQATTGWNLFGPLDHDSVLERDRSIFRGVVFYYDSFADPPIYTKAEEIQIEDLIPGDDVVPQGIVLKHQLAHWLFTIEPFEIDFAVLPEPAEVQVTTTTTTTTTLAGDED